MHSFQIGKDHTVCEDYALSAVEAGLAYAVVCDGCSASPDVDFGARVLALSAKESLVSTSPLRKALGVAFDPTLFGESVVRHAVTVARNFPSLHPQALDATLLAAWVQDKKLTAYLYGDGIFIHRRQGAVLDARHIQLSSGAPDYLSYSLEKARRESYDRLPDNQKEIVLRKDGAWETIFGKPFTPVVIETLVEEGDVIALVSDGMNSFRKADNSNLEWTDLIEEFTGFKTFEGQFVLRRLSAFKRKCLKDAWTHSDDISVAAIVV